MAGNQPIKDEAKWNDDLVVYMIQPSGEDHAYRATLSWYLVPTAEEMQDYTKLRHFKDCSQDDRSGGRGAVFQVHSSLFKGGTSLRYKQAEWDRTFTSIESCEEEVVRLRSISHPFIKLRVKNKCKKVRYYVSGRSSGGYHEEAYAPNVEVELMLPERHSEQK